MFAKSYKLSSNSLLTILYKLEMFAKINFMIILCICNHNKTKYTTLSTKHFIHICKKWSFTLTRSKKNGHWLWFKSTPHLDRWQCYFTNYKTVKSWQRDIKWWLQVKCWENVYCQLIIITFHLINITSSILKTKSSPIFMTDFHHKLQR